MSYLVLARKWRPAGFTDLVGQEPISRILSNAISMGRIAHAYVFSGPKGVGKTSSARILAKALNCEKGPTSSPCGVCTSCKGITDGSSVDVMEIDGASNNSVEDIRDLRERVKYAPAGGKYKVYIIDEAHMLSGSAFNALLKTLEEPPSHVVFVLATTASEKIPATVLSRCQHLPFRKIPSQKIKEKLRLISGSEGIKISDTALDIIARASEGSMRDSLTILDQISAFSSEIKDSEVTDLLGIADFRALSELSAAIISGDRKKILSVIAELAGNGTDFRPFSKNLVSFFRDLLVAKIVNKPEEILDVSDNEMQAMREILAATTEEHLTLLLSEMVKSEPEIKFAFSPRVALEMLLIRASFLATLKSVQKAIDNIKSFASQQTKGSQDAPELIDAEEPALHVKKSAPATEAHKFPEFQAAPETPAAAANDNAALRDRLLQEIEAVNHPLAGRLYEAGIRLDGDTIVITFNGGNAIHADAVQKNKEIIEQAALHILNRKVSLRTDTLKKKTTPRKEVHEKILAEPIIKKTIELFEGKIVDVKPIEDNGGNNV